MKFTEEWSKAAWIHGVRSGGSEVVAEAAWRLGTEEGLLSVSGHSGGSRHSTCLRHNQLSLLNRSKDSEAGFEQAISAYGFECSPLPVNIFGGTNKAMRYRREGNKRK